MATVLPPTPHPATEGWRATLDVEIVRMGERSVLGNRRHTGPLRIQRIFHPEGPVAHVYLLHPPGGVVGGDQLTFDVAVGPGADALFTTPAAQKLYRSAERSSSQTTRLTVRGGASLEWLPGETLVFSGARASQRVHVDLEDGARFVGWDLGCFGRPASGEPFASGFVRVAFEIWRGGTPLLVERHHVVGGSDSLTAPWAFADLPAWGTLYAACEAPQAAAQVCTAVRSALSAAPSAHSGVQAERFAVTAADSLVVVRVRGVSVEEVRAPLELAWKTLRPAVMGRVPVVPRIWAT